MANPKPFHTREAFNLGRFIEPGIPSGSSQQAAYLASTFPIPVLIYTSAIDSSPVKARFDQVIIATTYENYALFIKDLHRFFKISEVKKITVDWHPDGPNGDNVVVTADNLVPVLRLMKERGRKDVLVLHC